MWHKVITNISKNKFFIAAKYCKMAKIILQNTAKSKFFNYFCSGNWYIN